MVSELINKFNSFKNDDFKFDPIQHKYTYKGRRYISVTQFLKNFHEKFDSDYWSKVKAEKRGVEQQEILKEWQEKNDYANMVGSATHDWIENYYNKRYQTLPTNQDVINRINKFNVIWAKQLHKLEPVVFELRIFSKKYPIAGTIDSIFLYNGKLFILDYKTNGDFKHDDHPKGRYNKLLKPFDDLYQNHLNEYSIQVGLYALILKEWGFDIRGGYLLHLGPDTEAVLYKCKNLVDKLEIYLKDYIWE